VADYKLLKKGSVALKLGLENWFKRSRVWSIASVTRNDTWPNDESTELDTSFFRVASVDNDADKDEWKVLKIIGNASFFSQIAVRSKVREI
jgi:hypothetical protein